MSIARKTTMRSSRDLRLHGTMLSYASYCLELARDTQSSFSLSSHWESRYTAIQRASRNNNCPLVLSVSMASQVEMLGMLKLQQYCCWSFNHHLFVFNFRW